MRAHEHTPSDAQTHQPIPGRDSPPPPTLRDSAGNEQVIRTTDEHPFYVVGLGWVSAGELQAGMSLSELDGSNDSVIVSSLREAHPEAVTVYNLSVASDRTFFVADESGNAVWVHNKYEPVLRYQMAVRSRYGTIIYGTAQVTSEFHHLKVARQAIKLAKSGDYEYVILNRSWRTATGRGMEGAPGRLRPDVIAIGKPDPKTGLRIVDSFEIPSPSDKLNLLRDKLDVASRSLPGDGFVAGIFRVL